MDSREAEGELRALIAAKITEVAKRYPQPSRVEFMSSPSTFGLSVEEVAAEVVEHLVLDRQDILAALHEQPSRWWFMADSDRGPWVFQGGDEFNNPTIAIWTGRRRGYFVFSYMPRLNRELVRD